jgi:transposase
MEIIKMSKKELRRGETIIKVINGELTQKKAAEQICISLRQMKRLCKKFHDEGLQGLAHKSRGKASNKKIAPNARERVLELIRRDYNDFGPQLIKEQLEERNNIRISRESVRRLMIKEGLWKVKERKNFTFHQRRNQRPREGELLQIDGSPHYWFEERGPKCCLINMVDDATSKIMEMRFVPEECLEGYFSGMKSYIKKYGIPLAVYSDRHTIFKSPKSEEKPTLTQFGRAMEELGTELIFANSPQAKGRVERSHGTLQDRLIKMMRLEKISSIENGNKYLEKFRKEYNIRFGKKPQSEENAHRQLWREIVLDRTLCIKEKRKVSKNMEVRYKHKTYQLISKENLKDRAVLVCECKDGIRIEINGKECRYKIFEEQPYVECVMDRKKIDAFLDRKKPMSGIERYRRKIVNY